MSWKCHCGVVNFDADQKCKRCLAVKLFTLPTTADGRGSYTGYEAPEGGLAAGLLKGIGIGALALGLALAALTVITHTDETRYYSPFLVLLFIGQGVMTFALLCGLGVLLENTVAIRKNTQHLAAIRTDIERQPATWE